MLFDNWAFCVALDLIYKRVVKVLSNWYQKALQYESLYFGLHSQLLLTITIEF